jgi:hypothetical protein
MTCWILAVCSAANAQWGPEVKLSTGEVSAGLNENMGQCIIASGEVVHVIWMDIRNKDPKNKDEAIYYKRSTDKGLTWGPDTRISPTPSSDTMPLLALSGSTLHLTFLRNNQAPEAASYYKRSTDGGLTWGPDVFLGNTRWWPGVAAAGNNVYVSLNTVYGDDSTNSVVYFRRSTDNGATWEPQQQISHAPRRPHGRSEDPAIVAAGKYVHVVWNDNRDAIPGKGMSFYHRRSSDMGATWGEETALTHAPEYTYCPTICLNGANVEVAFADKQGGKIYHICHIHSGDFGSTWDPKQQISNPPGGGEVYPAIARDGSNVHMVWPGKDGMMYQHSGDGGKRWEKAMNLAGKGAIPFIAVARDGVHVIYASQRDGHGAIYYKRNPTGNKSAVAP